jgi:hypothetical protein
VPAGRVHEELERVEGARRRRCVTGLGRRLGAQDDVALLERCPERGQLVIGQLVLVGERLELLLLDKTALGGLLDQALGRREIVQVNRVAQFNPSLGRGGAASLRPPSTSVRGYPPAMARRPALSYRTAYLSRPFPNIANLRFPNIP